MISSLRSSSHRAALMAFVFALSVLPLRGLESQVFKSTTELVTVPLTVTNRDDDERVSGLTALSFRVFEDDVERPIVILNQESRPLSVCIVLDASTSMKDPRQTAARVAVQSMLDTLQPDDEVALVVFAKDVQVPIPWTRGSARPRVNWQTYQLADGTALNDALATALHLLDTATNRMTAVMVVSDGGENISRTSLSRVVRTRRQSEAMVYGANVTGPVPRPQAFSGDALADGPARPTTLPRPFVTERDFLGSLVGDSGGAVYQVTDNGTALTAAASFFEELRYLYTLAYTTSRAADGKFRRIRVEARDAKLRVRHRAGYLAMPIESPK